MPRSSRPWAGAVRVHPGSRVVCTLTPPGAHDLPLRSHPFDSRGPDKRISMRPPRYRFPDQVRSATRAMAARMVRQGQIARTAEQLDVWVSEHPDVARPLMKGGYGRAFDANDLFPLLEVFLTQEGARAPDAEARQHSTNRKRIAAAVLALLVLGAAIAAVVLS